MAVKVNKRRGRHWVDVDHNRRRKSKMFRSKDAANAVAKRVELELANGDLSFFLKNGAAVPGAGDESFKSYGARWLTDNEGNVKHNTYRFYEGNFTKHCAPVLGDRPVGEINRQDARRLVKTLRDKGCSQAVIVAACRTASAVISQAMEDGLRTFNPFFRMGKHTKSGDQIVTKKRKVKAMSKEQSKHLLDVVRTGWPWFVAFYVTALRTGMRLGELLALKWDAIDFKERSIEVRLNYTGGRFTSPKNKSLRTIDMSKGLVKTLQAHLVAMKAHALKRGVPLPDLVFCHWGTETLTLSWFKRRALGRTGPVGAGGTKAEFGTVLDGNNFRSSIHAKVMKAAGFKFTIKELRHTFASLLIFKSYVEGKPVTLSRISKLMGHSSIQITVDTYGHFIPDANDRAVVDCLDDDELVAGDGTAGQAAGANA